MVVKIGMVEKDEPIPIVTRSPITSIRNAPSGLLFPIICALVCTRDSTCPVFRRTAPNPAANHNKANEGHHTHSAC